MSHASSHLNYIIILSRFVPYVYVLDLSIYLIVNDYLAHGALIAVPAHCQLVIVIPCKRQPLGGHHVCDVVQRLCYAKLFYQEGTDKVDEE